MKDEEQIALKAACVQAAATLIADPTKGGRDVEECAKLAKSLYSYVVKIDWEAPT